MKSLKTTLVGIRRSPYQSLLAILMISLTFFVGFCFSLTMMGTESILKYFETRPQVIAFFKLDVSEETIKKLSEDIKNQDEIKSVKFISREEALELYQTDNKDNPLLLELVTADILPASIEVSAYEAESLPRVQEFLEQLDEVDEVVFQQDVVRSLTKWTKSVRIIGIASTSILGFVSFLMIVVMISMKISAKRGAIKIMKIIGASDYYVSLPFVLEGVAYGFLGSLLGWVSMYVTLLYITPWLNEFLGSIIALPVPWKILLLQAVLGTGFGVLLGGMASLVAAQRMTKK